MIDNRTLQTFLKDQGFYKGPIDGIFGPNSLGAMKALLLSQNLPADQWKTDRRVLALNQLFLLKQGIDAGAVDGLMGPQTRSALEEWVRRDRNTPQQPDPIVQHQPTTWPRQADVPAFYGAKGENQVLVQLPYSMRLAWDTKVVVNRISLHTKVADSARRAFERIHQHYGDSMPPGLDLYGGSLNVRKMRGGSQWSMHSWGIAIDFDPDNNQLQWGRDRARLARPEYAAFWDAWYSEGWIGLGRERNYDWMHVQAARL